MYSVRSLINLVEAKGKKKLELLPLEYKRTDLDPVYSKSTIDLHYGKLARGYVERFNKKEGDPEFNESGAFLHNILFAQWKAPSSNNEPDDLVAAIIRRKYGTYKKFQQELAQEAMQIQGSGWVYLSKSGSIKTIPNHEIRQDILLLIDWWEHAFILDYGSNKKSYLDNTWKIINWDVINKRL